MSRYNVMEASQINSAVSTLPIAELQTIYATTQENPLGLQDLEFVKPFKVTKVTNSAGQSKYVDAPSSGYKLVQHSEAFRPVIEGLTLAGLRDFKFSLVSDFKQAELNIYTENLGYDTVNIGFRIKNSFDRRSGLSYGLRASRQSAFIELVGYRQVCSNGAVIRVPLNEAEIIRPELRVRVLAVLADVQTKFRHFGDVKNRIQAMKSASEAIVLLKDAVIEVIKRGERITLSRDRAEELVKAYVKKRNQKAVLQQFADENQHLWGLYNAMTNVASHSSIGERQKDKLMESAAVLLAEVRA